MICLEILLFFTMIHKFETNGQEGLLVEWGRPNELKVYDQSYGLWSG